MPRSNSLLAGTVVPVVLGLAVAAGGGQAATGAAGGDAPATPGQQDTDALRLASCNPCNPCAGACNPCGPCNPCAGACAPCGACGACNPCAAGAAMSSNCVIPRLASACNPCSPCGPCNPCAAACNPCAANPCGPCNPCAAANPCNPCGPCNPCNPCAAGEEVELTDAEAREAYACIGAVMAEGYAKSGNRWAVSYRSWRNVAARPYVSDTHGARFVNNYANDVGADNYSLFEEAGPAPAGTVLAKDSFTVGAGGRVGAGPFFLMEKMEAGFNADTGDWRYTLIMPNGRTIGTTGGKGAARVGFCADCHLGVEEYDSRFFLDEEYRVQ